jgi:ankyrin repeat protein
MLASANGKTDTVELLLKKGANIEATNKVRIPQHKLSVYVFLTPSPLCRVV